MPRGRIGIILLLWLGPALLPALGQNHVSRRARAPRLETPPVADGLVNEPVWQQLTPLTDFVQQEPDEGQPATERTEVRIGYDDRFLYLGIICHDSEPLHIVSTQARRDAPLEDTDSFLILLDTFNDDQNAFVFGTTPSGMEYDGQVSKAGQGRGDLRTPSQRSSTGGGSGDGGGSRRSPTQRGGASAFNLNWDGVWWVQSWITGRGWEAEMVIPLKTVRYNPGSGRTWGLNITRNLRRRNEQSFWAPVSRAFTFNQVELAGGLEGLDLKVQRNLKVIPYVLGGLRQDYELADKQSKPAHDAGVDLKFSVNSSLTLDATFNTDFAQVEVDEEQVNLTRFDLFFPEKRPFFLENSGTFEFGGPREVEVFFSRRIGIDADGNQVPIDAGLRLSGKVGRYINWFNYAAKTRSPRLSGSDHALASIFEYDDEHHRPTLSYMEVGRNFNPEVGFLRRSGYRRGHFGYGYNHYPENRRFRTVYPHFQWNRWYTLGTNQMESGYQHYDIRTQFGGGGSFGVGHNRYFERIDEPFEVFPGVNIRPGRYAFAETFTSASTNPSAPVFAGTRLTVGRFYGGTLRALSFDAGLRRGHSLTWTATYTRNFIRLPEGRFNTDLLGLRFNWSFTPKRYLQTLTQYNSRTNQVGTNIRLAWLATSSTGFFLVYNTRVATVDFTDPHEVERRTLGRALFFKFNYLFDF